MGRPRGRGARGRRLHKVLPRDRWDEVIEAAAEERREPLLGVRDQAILALLLFSGIRAGELVALDRSDVDLDRGLVHVRHGKGDKERWAAIGAAGIEDVRTYLDVRPDPRSGSGDPLFVSRKGGRLDTRQVRRLVKDAGARAGHGADLHPHTCRHSHATQLVELGRDVLQVAEQLGHEDLETTKIYTHLSVEARRRIVEDM